MARERFEMVICEDGACRTIGRTTDEERAKRRVAREVKRAAKRRIRGRVPAGTVKGSVVDGSGLVRYRAAQEYGAPEPSRRPRRRPVAPPEPSDWPE